MLNGKSILVTGGTGSFGHQFVSYVLEHYEPKKIIIYSRDEYKQFVMQNEYKKHPQADKLRFFIGDVRDKERLYRAFDGVDYVVHAAALKQVPSCEFFPMEAVRTNVIGTDNVLTAAIEAGVESVICLSTDKAAYPINAMGITKAIEEKVALIQEKWLNLKCLGRRLRRFI